MSRTVPSLSTTAPKNRTSLRPSTRLSLISEHLSIFHRSDRVSPKTLEQQRFFAVPQREIKPTLEKEHRITVPVPDAMTATEPIGWIQGVQAKRIERSGLQSLNYSLECNRLFLHELESPLRYFGYREFIRACLQYAEICGGAHSYGKRLS
ncbi:hypothetical protein AVEN_146763-1 [Araneus ventricosus]|uniref:Uncharacterized protein n=1 Tax=Araneus ventricosus TaxID=182803 RepID=A0A4Y2D8Y0_ARAVE|nr:hypothetical protein AVEN_146763-1 [Araneus ventricosus]